jgi:phosphate transport system protein
VAVQLAVVARFYERIGDHAVNVSERTRFMINGWTREQDAVSRFRSRGDGTGEIAVASKND